MIRTNPCTPYLEEIARRGDLEVLIQCDDLSGECAILKVTPSQIQPPDNAKSPSLPQLEAEDRVADCVPQSFLPG